MPINISMSRPQNKNTLSLLKMLSVNNDRYKKRITATPKHSFWFKWYLIKILFGLQSRSHGTYVKISLKKKKMEKAFLTMLVFVALLSCVSSAFLWACVHVLNKQMCFHWYFRIFLQTHAKEKTNSIRCGLHGHLDRKGEKHHSEAWFCNKNENKAWPLPGNVVHIPANSSFWGQQERD